MDELKVLNFEEQEVRMQVVDGEPWFVANDVCKYFGVTNRNRVLQKLEDEEKGGTRMDTPGGSQDLTIINESGLYSLLFALEPRQARGISEDEVEKKYQKVRKFKRWVTSEVLPSIRKHGAYMTPDTLEQMLTNPDLLIGLANNLKEERAKRMQLETQIKEDSQYTAFGKITSNSSGAVKIGQFAKIVYDEHGINLGQNNMFAWLRENGYLIKDGRDKNIPLQRYVENGYFEVRPTIVTTNHGNIQKGTPLMTGKGQVAITKRLLAQFKPEMMEV